VNRFKFWDSDLQLSFNMRGANQNAQTRSLGIYTMDLAWSRDLFAGNATITLAVRDVFNNRIRRYYTSGATGNGGSFDTFGTFQWRQRQLTVNFSYRLNQQKQRGEKPRGAGFEGGGDY
jgi:hypothetical protein